MDFLDYLLFSAAPHHGLRKDTDRKVRALSHRISRRLSRQYKSQGERAAALEEALGRVAMLARALAELGVAKGAFTREELEHALAEAELGEDENEGA